MEKNYEDFMKQAEYRKTWSIAFFNATNAAIELEKSNPSGNEEETKKSVVKWRDFLLEEHAKYYAENIAVVGMQAISPKVVEGLDKMKEGWEKTNKRDTLSK